MIEAAMFGALSRDAEVKTSSKSGKAYLRLNLRIGEGNAAQWVNATVFDTTAIEAADKMVKGARVYIEGRLSLDEWTAQDGSKRNGLSAVSWHCRLSEIGRNRSKREAGTSETQVPKSTAAQPAFNDDIPF
jgi:single-strand DNA-binding protein